MQPPFDEVLKAVPPQHRRGADWMRGVRRKRNRGRAVVAGVSAAALVAVAVPLTLNVMDPVQTAAPAVEPSIQPTVQRTDDGDNAPLTAADDCAQRLMAADDSLDLRGATAVSEATAGRGRAVVIEAGGQTYSCLTAPGSVQPAVVRPLGPAGYLAGTGALDHLSLSYTYTGEGEDETYLSAMGRLPADAAVVEVQPNRHTDTWKIPVADGVTHAVHVLEGHQIISLPLTYVVRDAAGEVLFDSNEAAFTDEHILQTCAAQFEAHDMADGVDLTGAEILVSYTSGKQNLSSLQLDGVHYECGFAQDASGFEVSVSMPLRKDADGNWTGFDPYGGNQVWASHFSPATAEQPCRYAGVGDVSPEAATVELGGLTDTVTVPVVNGHYAFIVEGRQGQGPEEELTYRVLDADGEVLDEGTAWAPDPDPSQAPEGDR